MSIASSNSFIAVKVASPHAAQDSINTSVALSGGCQRCEIVPSPVVGPGALHLRFPLSHTLGKVRAALSNASWNYTEERGMVTVHITDSQLAPYLKQLCKVLSPIEQRDVRVIFQANGQELQMYDFFEVANLPSFVAQVQSTWLLDLLRDDRLTMWFQPIISCVDKKVFAYECLMRGLDGDRIIFPDQILEISRGANLLFQLDRAARLSAIRQATHFALTEKIFINFTPTSIYDPKNCLQTTLRAVDESTLSRQQIVFEVIESENMDDPHHLRDILNFYRDQGFEVALDDVGSGYSSLNMISRLRPDYMKLDRELVSGLEHDEYKALIAAKILETAQGLGITTIAEGVESEAEYQWLCDHGADYVQGYHIARPATPPPLLERSRTNHVAITV